MSMLRRLRASVVPLLIIAGATAAARATSPAPIHGMRYTLHLSMVPRGDAGQPVAMGTQDWTGKVLAANGRGRVDITTGQAPGMWAAGDYLLFDSTEFIIVHPMSKQFLAVPADIATRSFEQMKANGIDIDVTDVTASLEPVAGSDTVAGHGTRHYKMSVAYTLGMSMGTVKHSVQTRVTSDLWVAKVPDLPPSPFLRTSSSLGTGMMAAISAKVDSIVKPLAGATPLRSVTITQLSGAMPMPVETEQRVEVSDLAPAVVNDSLLVLPQGFTAGTLPGVTAPGDDSTGAKWRTLPGGGH